MPILTQPSSLWADCGKLSNDEIEGLIIEGRHLTELLQAELKLRQTTRVELDLGSEVKRKAVRIQRDGLSAPDLGLMADADNLGMAVMRDGLSSVKEGLIKWDHIAYTELIWLVSSTTTSAHALLLVLAVSKRRLEKINLYKKSMLVSYIKQHEETLFCACLESAARSLVHARNMTDMVPVSSSFCDAALSNVEKLELDVSLVVTDNEVSRGYKDSLATGPGLQMSTHNGRIATPTSQDVLWTSPACNQSGPRVLERDNTRASRRRINIPDPARPLSMGNSGIGRVEIVLKHIQLYTNDWSSRSSGGLLAGTILGPDQEKEAFNALRVMQDKLIYGVGIMAQKPTPKAWQLINEGCQMIDGVLLQQSRSMIRLLLRIFGGEGHFATTSDVRLGYDHPLSIILSLLQDKDVLESTLEQAFLVIMGNLEKELDDTANEMHFLRVDLGRREGLASIIVRQSSRLVLRNTPTNDQSADDVRTAAKRFWTSEIEVAERFLGMRSSHQALGTWNDNYYDRPTLREVMAALESCREKLIGNHWVQWEI
ncbi:Uu.00g024330.m01.CDS01 [Anthostomella pinea]|uniref:Uu.00g024330.m01.CDS01 n=1 Tax=Anthostomella pinea TaxID=933095 RepID=A0AAI8YR03_9PEZI|nr:Uu.00g024330.m01.CDS01 [Anthostomella pinea]